MRIGILVAMEKEMVILQNFLKESLCIGHFYKTPIYKVELYGHTITYCCTGIGKVNSAIITSKFINEFQPHLIINIGVAGGMNFDIGVGSVVVADRVAYHDVWCGEGTKFGQADLCPKYFNTYYECINNEKYKLDDVKIGLVCSGDRFIMYDDEISRIKTFFPQCLCVDMEAASIAHTCFIYNIDFLCIKVISDNPLSDEEPNQYEIFWKTGPKHAFEVVKKIIEKL